MVQKKVVPGKGRVLGKPSFIPETPSEAQLDVIPAPNSDLSYLVRLTCPEFTALCPVTGQPDFAHFVIDYVPDKKIVESKSLKLYLQSFRNHGAFHEACTTDIARKLLDSMSPAWLRVSGFWFPRGGIPIDIFFQTDEPPKGVFVPDSGVVPYRGRG